MSTEILGNTASEDTTLDPEVAQTTTSTIDISAQRPEEWMLALDWDGTITKTNMSNSSSLEWALIPAQCSEKPYLFKVFGKLDEENLDTWKAAQLPIEHDICAKLYNVSQIVTNTNKYTDQEQNIEQDLTKYKMLFNTAFDKGIKVAITTFGNKPQAIHHILTHNIHLRPEDVRDHMIISFGGIDTNAKLSHIELAQEYFGYNILDKSHVIYVDDDAKLVADIKSTKLFREDNVILADMKKRWVVSLQEKINSFPDRNMLPTIKSQAEISSLNAQKRGEKRRIDEENA